MLALSIRTRWCARTNPPVLTALTVCGAGSRDTTVIVWDVSLGALAAQARSRTRSLGGGSSAGIVCLPMVCALRYGLPAARSMHA